MRGGIKTGKWSDKEGGRVGVANIITCTCSEEGRRGRREIGW